MSELERRSSAKLHKQPEVEDDDGDEEEVGPDPSTPGPEQSSTGDDQRCSVITTESYGGSLTQPAASTTGEVSKSEGSSVETGVNISGVRTPTIQSASSSSETSPDEIQTHVPVTPAFTRKQTLIRTQALEGTSPPPELLPGHLSHTDSRTSSLDVPGHSLTNGGSKSTAETLSGQQTQSPSTSGSPSLGYQGQLQKKGSQEAKDSLLASQKVSNDSGHGTLDTTDAGSDTSVLSRDSSLENSAANLYRDSSGVNIPQFIRETMLKSPKDKKTVLTYEKQLIDFCRNEECHVLKMVEATSYDRMIAHRLSAFMGLEHNVDSTGKAVIINKTENMRVLKITDFIKLDDQEQDTKKKILLKKPSSLDEKHSRGSSKGQFGSHRAKSLEERQQIYSEARERIFNKEGESPGDTLKPSSLLTTHCSMPQLHHQRSLDSARPSCSTTSTSPIHPSMSSSAATPPPPSSLGLPQPHHHHQSSRHHHHLHPACWASMESAPDMRRRSGQGAADLRASTMIKSNSYGGVGSNPHVLPGLMGSDLNPGMALPGYMESPKDLSGVYSPVAGQGLIAPPPLCPSLVGAHIEEASSQHIPSNEGQPAAQQQHQQQAPLLPPPSHHHHHQPQQQQTQQSPSPQACQPNPSVAYLISSDYTSIPTGSLIIDPNTMQPHVNADGSLYRFNPSCPPPFMSQPVVQPSPSAAQLPYQMENLSVSDVSGKFPSAAGGGMEPGSGVPGQLMMSHPQAALSYPSPHPVQFTPQGQYYPSVSPSPVSLTGQPPFQVVTYTPSAAPVNSGLQAAQVQPQHQILHASPLEAQGQTTVPMPAVEVPGVTANLGGGATYVLGPAPYDISTAGGGPGVAMYTSYPPGVEAFGMGPAAAMPSQPHHQLVQYNLAAYGQPQASQAQATHVMVPYSGTGHATYFTAVPAPPPPGSTPTPPPPSSHPHTPALALSQLPPPLPQQIPVSMKPSSQAPHPHLQHHQHQLQQQHLQTQQPTQQQPPAHQPTTVFFSPGGMSNLTVFPSSLASTPQQASLVMAQPQASTASSLAKGDHPPTFAQYHSSPPPPHSLHNPTQQHPVFPAGTSSNGHHHHHHPTSSHQQQQQQQQLTLNCSGQPLSFCPTSSNSSSSVQRGGGTMPQQLVAYHPIRPVGTIVHLGGVPSVQPLVQPSPVGPAQLQPYQIIRPSGPVNPGSIRPRLTSLQFSNPHNHQSQSKSLNRQSKKGFKRTSDTKETEDVLAGREGMGSGLRASQTMVPTAQQQQYSQQQQQQQQQQQPILVTPVLPGVVRHPHIPSASSHSRQDPPAQL